MLFRSLLFFYISSSSKIRERIFFSEIIPNKSDHYPQQSTSIRSLSRNSVEVFFEIRTGIQSSQQKDVLTKTPCNETVINMFSEDVCFQHYRPNQIDKNRVIAHNFWAHKFCEKKEKHLNKKIIDFFNILCFNRAKKKITEKMLVRTWLLPQNFKAHKATKRERKKIVWFLLWNLRCYIKWAKESEWREKNRCKTNDWVTILMKDLTLKLLLEHSFLVSMFDESIGVKPQ